MERSFSFQWTPSLLRAVIFHLALRRHLTWVLVVMIVAAAGLGAWLTTTAHARGGVLLMALSGVALIAMFASLFLQARFLQRMCDIEVRVTLEPDELRLNTSSVESRLRWDGVTRMTIHPRMLLLWCRERGPAPIVLPRGAMTQEQVEFVRERMERAGGVVHGG